MKACEIHAIDTHAGVVNSTLNLSPTGEKGVLLEGRRRSQMLEAREVTTPDDFPLCDRTGVLVHEATLSKSSGEVHLRMGSM